MGISRAVVGIPVSVVIDTDLPGYARLSEVSSLVDAVLYIVMNAY